MDSRRTHSLAALIGELTEIVNVAEELADMSAKDIEVYASIAGSMLSAAWKVSFDSHTGTVTIDIESVP